MIKAGLNDKVPRNYFTPFLKITRKTAGGNTAPAFWHSWKLLVQNSAPVIFYDFLIRIKLDWLDWWRYMLVNHRPRCPIVQVIIISSS